MRYIVSLFIVILVFVICITPGQAATGEWTVWSPDRPFTALTATPDGATLYALSGALIYRSTDGGQSWETRPAPPGASDLRTLAIDPNDTQILYLVNRAAGQTPLWRSLDGGLTWRMVYAGDQEPAGMVVVSARPAHQVTLAVGGRFPSNGYAVLQSQDRGDTWREVFRAPSMMGAGAVTSLVALDEHVLAGTLVYHGGGLAQISGPGNVWGLGPGSGPKTGFAAPLTLASGPIPDTLYVAWTANGPFMLASLRKTTDAGKTWQDVTPPLKGKSGEQITTTSDGPRLTALTVHPYQDNQVYVAATWCDKATPTGCAPGSTRAVVLASLDGGASWQTLGEPLPVTNIVALRYSQRFDTLLAATDQGVWRFTPGQTATGASYPIAVWFRRYYETYDGVRLLGQPLGQPTNVAGWPAQLFEKGRVEDHSAVERDPAWKFMYGLLVDELIAARSPLPVGGDRSTLTYADLAEATSEDRRLLPPSGLTRGISILPNGNVFIPLDPQLNAGPGHSVPPIFWAYINRADLFPGGWLHDVGLPISEPLTAVVDKGDALNRRILIQAFQRTVLTYDPANPAGWQVERANVGRDYAEAFK